MLPQTARLLVDELDQHQRIARWLPPQAALEARIQQVRQELDAQDLDAAAQALEALRQELSDHRAGDDQRLGPDAAALRDHWAHAIRGADEVAALRQLLDRTGARRQAGLAHEPVLARARALSDRLASPTVPPIPVIVKVKGGKTPRLAWADGGCVASAEPPREPALGEPHLGGQASEADRQAFAAWGVVGSGPQGDRISFVLHDGAVEGPYRGGVPLSPLGAVGRLDAGRFAALFGRIDVPGTGRWLVPDPPTLQELLIAGAEIRDQLDDESVAQSLLDESAPGVTAEGIEAWLRRVLHPDLPPEVLAARRARFGALLPKAKALEEARAEAIATWLDSDASAEARQKATETVALRETAALQQRLAVANGKIAELDRAFTVGMAKVDATIAQKRAELESELGRLAAHREAQLAKAAEEDAAAHALRHDRRFGLLAELFGEALAGRVSGGAPPQVHTPPTLPVAILPQALPPWRKVIEDLAGDEWDRDDVANFVVTVATGRWTLLAGPPGVGKSTFARSILSRMGHGPGSERYLELVARRDWQDDSPLFGFWNPTTTAWEPSPEGFLEHLLLAVADHEAGHDGVFPVLVEELNLASPEHYLTRPISAFEAPDPTIRLYDRHREPTNGHIYPPSFRIPDAVRLLATVNVDDTVEKLSPRLLSRANVFWMGHSAQPRLVWRPDTDGLRHELPWSALARLGAEAPPNRALDRLFGFLIEARVPAAPSARTRQGIARWLGASRGLIDERLAIDLQISQRVLPPLRGVGPRFRVILEDLAQILHENRWERSERRVVELIDRGGELGDWYDFFHA